MSQDPYRQQDDKETAVLQFQTVAEREAWVQFYSAIASKYGGSVSVNAADKML